MPGATDRWTADRVRELPDDGNRYELIAGELVVTPAPRAIHQIACRELGFALHQALAGTALGVLQSPADLPLGGDEVFQPDLFVYRTTADQPLHDWSDIGELLLVAEVLSPSTARYDRGLKRVRYQRAGVPEYWVVDLDARLIERWRPADVRPEVTRDRLVWGPSAGERLLDLDLAGWFARVWGDDIAAPPGPA